MQRRHSSIALALAPLFALIAALPAGAENIAVGN